MVMADYDSIIPPNKLELTPDEARLAQQVVNAASDSIPKPSSMVQNFIRGMRRLFGVRSAGDSVQWPPDDKAVDYHHWSPDPPPAMANFTLRPEDIEFVLAANRFEPHGKFKGQDAGPDEIIALAVRGLSLGTKNGRPIYEIEEAKQIDVIDVRPNHRDFRCCIGFYSRTADPAARRLTLYAGSTVPAAAYMIAYRNNYLADPNGNYDKCNMLPSGCYVCRVASHHHDEIKPALRMSRNDNLGEDAECTVVRNRQ